MEHPITPVDKRHIKQLGHCLAGYLMVHGVGGAISCRRWKTKKHTLD